MYEYNQHPNYKTQGVYVVKDTLQFSKENFQDLINFNLTEHFPICLYILSFYKDIDMILFSLVNEQGKLLFKK